MPGPNVTQVHEENCFISLSIVNSAAVPPPSECQPIYRKIIITIKKGSNIGWATWLNKKHTEI